MNAQPVLIAGQWRPAEETGQFSPRIPTSRGSLEAAYPISGWSDCNRALDAAQAAAEGMQTLSAELRARFLESYADRIEASAWKICAQASLETGLPMEARFLQVELPRTCNQLRKAAAAAREGSWAQATIDTQINIRSQLAPIGPVVVFGPNNFPLAFNAIAGGDFAAAIAAGNPVIAKGHSAHPGTCQLLAELAFAAQREVGLPAATVQMIFGTAPENGLRLVSDPRTGAASFTGSRHAGLALKRAADEVGKPFYAELSSINPVVVLPGALGERCERIAQEFAESCLLGSGQFCTNPGLLILPAGEAAEHFVARAIELFTQAPVGTLLGEGTERNLAAAVAQLRSAGAKLLTGGNTPDPDRFCYANTLLRVSGRDFLGSGEFQTEAFGNAALVVVSEDSTQTCAILDALEGNLTGCIYSCTRGADDADYAQIAPHLRRKVGRLLNDRMPTGVAVSPAMNHGGPYPASGHPGFTAVGIPASMRRFARLECYDNVRAERLPPLLADRNPGSAWRLIDGNWSRENI